MKISMERITIMDKKTVNGHTRGRWMAFSYKIRKENDELVMGRTHMKERTTDQ